MAISNAVDQRAAPNRPFGASSNAPGDGLQRPLIV
jgi:hypothetical protein